MQVEINGKSEDITEATLEELCKRYLDLPTVIATAVNGTFITVHERAELILQPGDKIEILSPRQGG
ncbi:MAG: thiamine biosynthesis protein ThiS [Rhodomicrobium sp.]|nr:MAG: thiamine biosynthesis protein ThiS [Rhodomicrobium sp.]